jgi:hypothetical protein
MMRVRSWFMPLLVMFTVLPSGAALGWGSDGHEIIAHIAESRLTPRARAAVGALLDGQSLADASTWADDVREERAHTAPWHYVNIPYEMRKFDRGRDGKNGNNVVDQCIAHAKVLDDRRALRQRKVESLKFLVHFVGDLHQPLHCAERNEDRGGNFRLVFFPGQRQALNLHRVWDVSILGLSLNKSSTRDYADELHARLTRKIERAYSRGDPVGWANESHALAVRIAYAGIPADGPPPTIDDAYLRAAQPVVDEQLLKAGVRLANVLNHVFR